MRPPRKVDSLADRTPSERFEQLDADVCARLADRGIDPDESLRGFLNEIRTGKRFGELLTAARDSQET